MRPIPTLPLQLVFFCWVLWSANCSDQAEQRLTGLTNPSPVKRAAAVKGMAKYSDQEAYLWLSRALDDPSTIVRIAAVQALVAYQGRDTLAGLMRASGDKDPEVRQAAVAALAQRQDQRALNALVQILSQETDTKIRLGLFSSLASKGLSGQQLARKLADRQMDQAVALFKEPFATQRIKAVRLAGNLVHPDGLALVHRALDDKDPDVVLAALAVLDGRGGKKSVQKLKLLLADEVPQIRSASLEALTRFGQTVLNGAESTLQDPEPEVVLKALALFSKLHHRPSSKLICPLLLAPNNQVAIQSAMLLKQQEVDCSLDALAKQLRSDDNKASTRAMAVLSAIGNPASRKIFEKAQKSGAQNSLRLWVALAQAGSSSPSVLRRLKAAYRRSIRDIKEISETWVTGKIAPLAPPARLPSSPKPISNRTESTSQLSQQELASLYKKYGLDPPNTNSPRSIDDILAKYESYPDQSEPTKLINPLGQQLIDDLSMSLDGLLYISPKEASALLADVFSLPDPRLLAQVAQLLERHAIDVEIDPSIAQNLGQALSQADAKQAKGLVRILSHNRHPAATQQLLHALQHRSSAIRAMIIEGLANRDTDDVVQTLIAQLKGYACVPAAHALAKGKHSAAIEPLLESLKRAGPAEEMEIQMALATLHSYRQLPDLLTKIGSVEAKTRLSAVRVLEKLGGDEAYQAIGRMRWDIDRRVRAEVKRILSLHDDPKRATP